MESATVKIWQIKNSQNRAGECGKGGANPFLPPPFRPTPMELLFLKVALKRRSRRAEARMGLA
jgi:hypothetical protein